MKTAPVKRLLTAVVIHARSVVTVRGSLNVRPPLAEIGWFTVLIALMRNARLRLQDVQQGKPLNISGISES